MVDYGQHILRPACDICKRDIEVLRTTTPNEDSQENTFSSVLNFAFNFITLAKVVKRTP